MQARKQVRQESSQPVSEVGEENQLPPPQATPILAPLQNLDFFNPTQSTKCVM